MLEKGLIDNCIKLAPLHLSS